MQILQGALYLSMASAIAPGIALPPASMQSSQHKAILFISSITVQILLVAIHGLPA